MAYERWGPLYRCLGLPGLPLRLQAARGGCATGGLVVCIRDDALYKLQLFYQSIRASFLNRSTNLNIIWQVQV